jgi:murein DD-endopeptidase MepM/ murein hydrolase activator NlpD
MNRRQATALLLLGLPGLSARLAAQDVVRRVGRVTIRADVSQAFPGGVVVVRLRGRVGAAWALLDGRRARFFPQGGVPRALVPVALAAEAGPATLGIGIAARRGEQRIAVSTAIVSRGYPATVRWLPETLRPLTQRPEAFRDSRRLLGFVRTQSDKPVPGVLYPPVGGIARGFGELRRLQGAPDVEKRIDSLEDERHRGVDYPVPAGTPVKAPGAGSVLFAGPLALAGETIVIDHGQGVVSALLHLSRLDVQAGTTLDTSARVGLSGATGLAPEPLVEWRVYLHGVAVDPLVIGPLLG